MPLLRNVEKSISKVERFNVHFYRNGKNVNGNKEGIPQYRKSNASPGSWTVSEWKRNVFTQQYPGYDVIVLDAYGEEVHGGVTLTNLRDTY